MQNKKKEIKAPSIVIEATLLKTPDPGVPAAQSPDFLLRLDFRLLLPEGSQLTASAPSQ